MLPPFPCSPATPAPARLSVVVTNHNYARFLPVALASVLSNGAADVQVVVVDDGSTDDSRAVLARYGARIRPILQEHLGQKAAFNAGFAATDGDVVLFLDADDEIRPGTLDAVRAAFAAHPEAARVVFRLAVVDEQGRPTGAVVPAAGMPLPDGDVRRAVLSHPDDLAWPPTSGNAWASWALQRLLPLSVDADLIGADQALHSLVPLFGPVVALDLIGGAYRLHARNGHLRDDVDVARSRAVLLWSWDAHIRLDDLARALGHPGARPRSVTVAAHRLVSLRLGGAGHPVPGDTRRRALGAGLRAVLVRTDASAQRRVAYATWFVGAAFAPEAVVHRLARAGFQSVRATSMSRRLLGR